MSRKKPIPHFQSEEQEQAFWEENDSADFIDWSEARPVVLANLRPSTKTISLRLPKHMLEGLKRLANKRDVPYQSLLKVFLAERIEAELKRMRSTAGARRQGPDPTMR
jgi:predicted DNA binding CopG/RHH family protein